MKKIRVGLIGEAISTVTESDTAKSMGSGILEVYATPAMIALMEEAAVNAIDPHLSTGLATVGIEVDVEHLSATPIGERIMAVAEITYREGKRVKLEVRAWDEKELIGSGSHTRYIIEVDEFMDRLR